MSSRPLDGIRVLELGTLVAGPFAGTLLGYFGAEVIKVEPPGGDPIRGWRGLDQGTSLWWRAIGRNKKSVVIDLRQAEGLALVRTLCARVDVLVENFRPGTLEKWGLDVDVLRAEHPQLIVARTSGFGQTGPYAERPGFASVCEAFAGLRYITGEPGQPPVRANLSLGDSLAGLHTALGVLLALCHRLRGGAGQVVDTAITESVLNMLESVIPEYDRLGAVRQPSGRTITGVAPTGAYPCADGHAVVIGANSEPIFRRLCQAMGRAELADDPRFADNEARVANRDAIEAEIARYTSARTRAEVLAELDRAQVPAGPIYDAADIAGDPHYQARGLFESVPVGDRPLALPALAPRLSDTPGRTDWAGPDAGAHTDQVLAELAGLSADELAALRARGVIA